MFAEIDKDNVVLRVIVADSLEWCETNLGGTWVETFEGKDGHNYAGKGHAFDEDAKNFIEPQPYPSWELDKATCKWKAPVTAPVLVKSADKEEFANWDEDRQEWTVIDLKAVAIEIKEEA